MAIFSRILIKSFAIFFSILIIIAIVSLIISFFDNQNNEEFTYISGKKDSPNIIALIELNGLIIENNTELRSFTNPFIISPSEFEKTLKKINKISPKVIIISIDSPGGTVSASKHLYEVVKNFKKNNNVQIIFHSKELLASGGYWVSTAGDRIYANYGSIIGSIGVKGPEWFFYNKPTSISTGIFGNEIKTREGIEIFSSSAGKSKDIFNPFRRPNDEELKHLQKIVDNIYSDFIRIVSNERKIEINTIENNIGALIYSAKDASTLYLIDGQLSLNEVIDTVVSENKFKDYKIIKKFKQKNSLLKEIIMSKIIKTTYNTNFSCISLRSSISVILSYQSTGC